MSLLKDMTINERVFHHNINNRPSYVIHHLILFNIYYYLPTCGIQITCGHFREFTNVKEAFTASGVLEERFRDFLLRLEHMGEPGLCAGVGAESSWTLGFARSLGFGIGLYAGGFGTSQGY